MFKVNNMKKGELSMNIIIAAAIGVLVLVVVGAIFVNNMKQSSGDIQSCSAKGGVEDSRSNCETYGRVLDSVEMEGDSVCCINTSAFQ